MQGERGPPSQGSDTGGESFAKWLDDENNVLGTEPEIDISLYRDTTVRTVVPSDPVYFDHDYDEWIEYFSTVENKFFKTDNEILIENIASVTYN